MLMDLNEKGRSDNPRCFSNLHNVNIFTGFFPLNHYGGLNSSQLLTVVERLAEFHAIGSALLLKEETTAKKFKRQHAKNCDNSAKLYESLFPQFRDFAKFLRRVPGFYYAFEQVDQLRPKLSTYLARARRRSGNACTC